MQEGETYTIYYDGECALCHGFVGFVLKRDSEAIFRFAPLQSEHASELVSKFSDVDSVLVQDAEGKVFIYSDAVVFVLRKLGGSYAFIGSLIALFPRLVRDFGYRIVAACRRKLLRKPSELCPVLPQDLRDRFLS